MVKKYRWALVGSNSGRGTATNKEIQIQRHKYITQDGKRMKPLKAEIVKE